MNFKRIEWIFLVAFIVLDFFLMTTYFHQDSIVESTTNTSTQDSTASLMKSLKNDQISHGKLSDKSQSGYYLAAPKDGFLREKATQLHYVTWSYSNHKLTASFITGIKLNLTNPQNSLDSVVKDAAEVPMGKHYSFNGNLSTKNTIVYTQELYGKPVYSSEGQIRFTVKDGYVTDVYPCGRYFARKERYDQSKACLDVALSIQQAAAKFDRRVVQIGVYQAA